MSRAAELLAQLHELGVTATLTPAGKVAIEPDSRVPDPLWTELTAHRDELAELLAQVHARTALVPEPWRADPAKIPRHAKVGEDPRPDLDRSDLWERLLRFPLDADDPLGVYGRLLGARARGAVLEVRAGRWKLAPTLDPTERVSVWATRSDWDRDAAIWLKPESREVVALLALLPVPAESQR